MPDVYRSQQALMLNIVVEVSTGHTASQHKWLPCLYRHILAATGWCWYCSYDVSLVCAFTMSFYLVAAMHTLLYLSI